MKFTTFALQNRWSHWLVHVLMIAQVCRVHSRWHHSTSKQSIFYPEYVLVFIASLYRINILFFRCLSKLSMQAREALWPQAFRKHHTLRHILFFYFCIFFCCHFVSQYISSNVSILLCFYNVSDLLGHWSLKMPKAKYRKRPKLQMWRRI